MTSTSVDSRASALAAWRADTPGCTARAHLNNAGAALVPQPVADAVTRHLALESTLGGYEAAEAAADALAQAYASVGRLLGTLPRNIAFAQNSTVAFTQALSAFDFAPGDTILTTRNDYASNQITFLSLARRRGIAVLRAEDLPEGGVDPDSVRELLRRRPALVALTWVPTNSGLVQAAEAVGAACEEAGVPYLVDACQAVGQMPVSVARLRCDYLAATGRKFLRGPRGIGFLYVSDRALASGRYPLLVDMQGATWTGAEAFELAPDARRFETWECACSAALGLGAAVRYALDVGLETAQDRARTLAAFARERLAAIPGVRVLDRGAELCAIVAVALDRLDPVAVKLELRRRGINTSTTTRTSALIDMDDKGVEVSLRISPHYYNTGLEITRAAEELAELMADARRR